MKKQILSILLIAMALPVMVFGADKLGVAEPVSKGALKAEEVGMLWSMLEASILHKMKTDCYGRPNSANGFPNDLSEADVVAKLFALR